MRPNRAVAVVFVACCAAGFLLAAPAGAAPAKVTGTALYLQRIALPPTAILTVQLVDISRQDAPATVIAKQTIPTNGQAPPYAFALDYDTTAIAPNLTYAVQARIEDGGRLLFITTQAYLVITQGRPTTIDVTLSQVTGQGSPAPSASPAPSVTPNLPATGGGGMAGKADAIRGTLPGLAGVLASGGALFFARARGRARAR
jgi:putative lipoprotein